MTRNRKETSAPKEEINLICRHLIMDYEAGKRVCPHKPRRRSDTPASRRLRRAEALCPRRSSTLMPREEGLVCTHAHTLNWEATCTNTLNTGVHRHWRGYKHMAMYGHLRPCATTHTDAKNIHAAVYTVYSCTNAQANTQSIPIIYTHVQYNMFILHARI